MRLKIAITVCLVIGVLMLLGWPFFVQPKPPSTASKRELAMWGLFALKYVAGVCFVFLLTAFLCALRIRQARDELSAEFRTNINELVEGTLKDHERKSGQELPEPRD